MIKRMHLKLAMGTAGAAVIMAIGGLAATQIAVAEEPTGRLAVDLGDCVELATPEERFACYENRVNAALRERGEENGASDAVAPAPEAAAPEAPVAAPAAAAPAPQTPAIPAERAAAEIPQEPARRTSEATVEASTDDDFGLRRPSAEREVERQELIATIAAVRETVPDTYLITLENGQVWRQMRPRRYPLRVGHEVRIYPTGWGQAYRLAVNELGGFIQVERVR